VDLKSVQTNIVIFYSSRLTRNDFINKLKEKGVLISSGSYENMRAVFHMDVNDNQVNEAVEIIRSV
ncbi:MAG: low specificity L-threonine aldolase, partial [bacterium]